jgi:hypothetical protein
MSDSSFEAHANSDGTVTIKIDREGEEAKSHTAEPMQLISQIAAVAGISIAVNNPQSIGAPQTPADQ